MDVLGAACEKGVRDIEPPLSDPDLGPPPPPLLEDAVVDLGVDDAISSTESSLVLMNFNLIVKQTRTVLKF